MIHAAVVLVEIARVAAEQLVAADAGQNHGDVLARELRDQIRRDERRVRDRLVHVPDQLRQERGDVGLHEDLVMIGAERLRHLARVRQLVVQLRAARTVEADRIRLHRVLAVATS